MRPEKVEVSVPVGVTNKRVTVIFTEGQHYRRMVIPEEVFRELMSEGEKVLEHWDGKPLPWGEHDKPESRREQAGLMRRNGWRNPEVKKVLGYETDKELVDDLRAYLNGEEE